jgi:hypothetical protein
LIECQVRKIMIYQEDDNRPITIGELAELLAVELSEFDLRGGGPVSLEPLDRLKEVADATTKVLIRDSAGLPEAVILCSRPISPDLVKRGIENAEAIRRLIGESLGTAIIKPLHTGCVDGRSYAILPWCRGFSRWKPVRIVQRLTMIRPLLGWLREATAEAVAAHGQSSAAASAFANKLMHLANQPFLDDEIRTAAKKALQRLETNRWQPRYTFDHNDLWLGNIMLPKTDMGSKRRYVLIDWVGANEMGYGIYDLVRLAMTMKIPAAILRRELLTHSQALQCEPEDTGGHLLAALGRLHQHLECFPEERYIHTLRNCWTAFQRARSV